QGCAKREIKKLSQL
ncbi:unnamed protein product, partial [Allacma fusca]